MPLPTLSKTYEFDINNAVSADGTQAHGFTDATNDRKELLLGIKNSLISGGTFTVPWTVRASSNASAAGHDNVDRWSTIADLRWTTGTSVTPPSGVHSWIILYHSVLDIELLIDCANTINSDGSAMLAYISVQGFGAANGGTDGTTTTRPFAVDEVELRNGFNNNDGAWSGGDTGGGRTWKWHVTASDDGEVWNVLIYQSNTLTAFWRYEIPRNPPGNWQSPVVAIMYGFNDDSNNADNDGFTGVQSGSRWVVVESARRDNISQFNADVELYTWGWSGTGSNRSGHSRLTSVHPITGNPMLWDTFYFTRTEGLRGRLGRPTDLWLRQNTVGGSVGDTYPNNPATPQFVVLSGTTGGFILPWDGATTPQTA